MAPTTSRACLNIHVLRPDQKSCLITVNHINPYAQSAEIRRLARVILMLTPYSKYPYEITTAIAA